MLLTAAAWSSLTGLVLWQALRGQSITTPDALTWATTGALMLAAIVCGAVISCRAHRDLRNHQVVAPQALRTPM